MVERPGEREGPGEADASVGRLQTDDAAERRRDADRAARIAAEGERHLVGRERDRRATAGAARHPLSVPRVPRRALEEVDGGDPPGELVGRGLPDQDRAGLPRPAHRLRIHSRDVAVEHRGAVRGADFRRVEQVLDPERDPLERPRSSLGVSPRRLLRLLAGPVERERRERVDQRLHGRDPLAEGVDDLHRRQLARTVALEELAGR
jgi:hypothetical protein